MKPYFPFAAFGLAAAAGFLGMGQPALSQSNPGTARATSAEGSVQVVAQLEHEKLLRSGGETFARIVLEGKAAPTTQERLPVSLTLIIDQSGSMSGEKIEHARRSAVAALEQLRPGDLATVVAFSSGARVLVDRLHIGDDNLDAARRAILRLPATGGTDMVSALNVGGAQARKIFADSRTNRILLLSDGQPDTQAGLREQVAALAQAGMLTTTLGVGRDYNEDLMSRLADAGLGNYYFIERPEMTASIFEKELKTLASVVAKEAVVTIALKDGVFVDDVVGYEFSRGKEVVAIPVGDIYSERKSDILAKVRFSGAAAGKTELLEVKVTYHDALAGAARRVNLPLAAVFTENQQEVVASAVPEVVEKAEKVRTAKALEEVAAAYARGDKDEARQIANEQKGRLAEMRSRYAAMPAATAAVELSSELDDLAAEAEAPAADARVYGKKAKAAARAYKKR
jgi:Ca-activated chloride channel family protein